MSRVRLLRGIIMHMSTATGKYYHLFFITTGAADAALPLINEKDVVSAMPAHYR